MNTLSTNPYLLYAALGLILLIGTITGTVLLRKKKSYRLNRGLLTQNEQHFWKSLLQAIPPGTFLTIKPRLGDIFAITGKNKTDFYRISSKHVDFLLIDSDSRPLLGIELDDKSHERKDRIQRDRFVDSVFHQSGLPLLHVPARGSYYIPDLKTRILELTTPTK